MRRGEVYLAAARSACTGPGNGLGQTSHLMVDKLTTMPRANLSDRLGRLEDEDMLRLGRAMVVFLGVAGSGP